MKVVFEHPANAGVLRHYCGTGGARLHAAGDHPDPYYGAGCHPDIVERVWDQLGTVVPKAGRRLLCNSPVLLDPGSGLIIATCMGTQYCIRVADSSAALRLGLSTTNRWSDGSETDLAAAFGEHWFFGGFKDQELDLIDPLTSRDPHV